MPSRIRARASRRSEVRLSWPEPGKAWARAVGMLVVLLNLVGTFVFIPNYPAWAVLLIALDVAAIWGLARYDGHVR